MHILWKSFLKISPGPPGMSTQVVYCTTAGNTIRKDYNLNGAPEAVQCTISKPCLVSLYFISYIISVLSFSNSYWMNVGTCEAIIYVTYLFFLFYLCILLYGIGGRISGLHVSPRYTYSILDSVLLLHFCVNNQILIFQDLQLIFLARFTFIPSTIFFCQFSIISGNLGWKMGRIQDVFSTLS